MTPDNYIPFWNALPEKDRTVLTENIQISSNPGNGFFSSKRFMQGGLLFLLDGHIRIFLSSETGREVTLVTMGAGDTYLVHPGEERPVRKGQLRFQTSEDCTYAFLPKNTMYRVMGDCPEALAFVLGTEELLVRRLTENLSYSVFLPVRSNLARTLLEKSRFSGSVALTHEELANELGTTRVVISRELKKLEEYGLIRLGRGSIEILYREGLAELAE